MLLQHKGTCSILTDPFVCSALWFSANKSLDLANYCHYGMESDDQRETVDIENYICS